VRKLQSLIIAGSYVAGFIGSHDAQYVVRRLLSRLGERFPSLQELYDQHLEGLLADFFRPTIGEFLDAHSDSVSELSTDFPAVYDLFMTPLTESPIYKDRKLFNFYCNPWTYNPILEVLAKRDGPDCFSERCLGRLENCLGVIRLCANDESWDELTIKSRELLKHSDKLEAFGDACSGLLGEINTAFYMGRNLCLSDDELIFLEDKNHSGEKNCDLMIVRENEGDRILIEVKTKSPRHGVDDVPFKVWDDLFSNYSNAISSYLEYLDRKTGLFKDHLNREVSVHWI